MILVSVSYSKQVLLPLVDMVAKYGYLFNLHNDFDLCD